MMKEGKEEFFVDEEEQYDNKYSQHNMNIIQHLGRGQRHSKRTNEHGTSLAGKNISTLLLSLISGSTPEKTYRHFFCRP